MRDHVISRHSPDELRVLQTTVVDTILAARPEPGGFPMSNSASLGTFEHYVASQLYWHFRGSLEKGEDPPERWLTHLDKAVKVNVAMAVGLDALSALSKEREVAGELVRAAHASWAASLLKGIPMSILNDLVHRAADLLERADDKKALEFEQEVLLLAWRQDVGSERANKAAQRQKVLAATSETTFEGKVGEALAAWMDSITKLGVFGGDINVAAALEAMRGFIRLSMEISELTENPSHLNFWTNLVHAHVVGGICVASPLLERLDPHEFGSEAKIVEGVNFYKYDICRKIHKESMNHDPFNFGYLIFPLVLYCTCEISPFFATK